MATNDQLIEARSNAQLAVLEAIKKAVDEEWPAAVILDFAKAYNQISYSQGGA